MNMQSPAFDAVHAARLRFGFGSPMANEAIQKGQEYIDLGLRWCESPIEEAMLPALVLGDWDGFLTFPVPVVAPDADEFPACDIMIVPQFPISRYRLDFAIVCEAPLGAKKIFAVECDGFRFHESARDARRDLHLRGLGVTTIRFGGGRINTSPAACAQWLISVVTGWRAQQ